MSAFGASTEAPADRVSTSWLRKGISGFFDRDRGMVFFVAFLALTTIVVPAVPLSRLGQFALALIFGATLIMGAVATIQHRALAYLVVVLAALTTASTFKVVMSALIARMSVAICSYRTC